MPTPEARALSIQSQFAVELIAGQVAAAAGSMLLQAGGRLSQDQVDELAKQYEVMILGAMSAAAASRIGYFQGFAKAAGQEPFRIPVGLSSPKPSDVLARGVEPRGAVIHAVSKMRQWHAEDELAQAKAEAEAARKAAAEAQAAFERQAGRAQATARREAAQAEARLRAQVARSAPARNPVQMASSLLSDYADSTVMATSDYVDREVLRPDGRVVALRRVAHPGACSRCTAVAGVLVFKNYPALRHEQCRCTLEPVFRTDGDYQARLSRYRDLAGNRQPGRLGRDRRSRGNRKLAAAQARENSVWLQDEWEAFLKDEQARLAQLVKTVPSNTYRDWAVMTSANQSQGFTGMLPVITRK